MNNKTVFETVCAVAGGLAGFLFGAADGMLFALIAFVVLDYVTGIANAVINKKLSSRVGFSGICKKVTVFALVALANIIDIQVIGGGGFLRSAAVSLFLANEGLSIVENASEAGLPVPKILVKTLEQLKDKEDEKNG